MVFRISLNAVQLGVHVRQFETALRQRRRSPSSAGWPDENADPERRTRERPFQAQVSELGHDGDGILQAQSRSDAATVPPYFQGFPRSSTPDCESADACANTSAILAASDAWRENWEIVLATMLADVAGRYRQPRRAPWRSRWP